MTDAPRVVRIETDWPPTVNHYWGTRGKGRFVKREGLAYRQAMVLAFYDRRAQGFDRAQVRVRIEACPPDRRRRDLDNILKAVLDSLSHARVFADDSQVIDLHVRKGPQIAGGRVLIEIEEA